MTPNQLWGVPFAELSASKPESVALLVKLKSASQELQAITLRRAKRLAQEIEQRAADPLQLNPYETAIFNFSRYIDIIASTGRLMKLNDLPPVVFQVFPHLTRDEIPALKNYFAYYQQQRFPFSAIDSQELQTQLGEEGAQNKIKSLIVEILERFHRIKSHPILKSIAQGPASGNIESDLRRIAFRSETNRLGPADVFYLKDLYISTRLMEDLLTDGELLKNLSAKVFRKEDYLNLPQTRKILERLKQAETENKEIRLWLNEEKHDTDQCLIMLKRLDFVAPTQEEIDEFKVNLPVYQNHFIQTLQPYLSADAFKTLQEAAARWTVIFPPSREKQIQLLKRDLEQILADARKLPNEPLTPSIPVRLAMNLLDLSSTVQRQTDIGRLCKRIANDLPGDFVSGHNVQLSPYTVRFKDQRGALTHELMHLALKALSEANLDNTTNSWIEKTKKCLRENHSEEPTEKMIEEDFADLFAFSTESAESSFICPTTDIQHFLPMASSPLETIDHRQWRASFYKSQSFDRGYSSPFFRLIHSNIVRKGDVPEVCRQVVAREKTEIKIKNCLVR